MTKIVHIKEMNAPAFQEFLIRGRACGGGRQFAGSKSLSYALQLCQKPSFIGWTLGEMCAQGLADRAEVVTLLLNCADYVRERLKIDFREVDFVIRELRDFTQGKRSDRQVYDQMIPLDKKIGEIRWALHSTGASLSRTEKDEIQFRFHFSVAIRNILSLASFVNTNAIMSSDAMTQFGIAHLNVRRNERLDYIDRVYAQFLREHIEVIWW